MLLPRPTSSKVARWNPLEPHVDSVRSADQYLFAVDGKESHQSQKKCGGLAVRSRDGRGIKGLVLYDRDQPLPTIASRTC